MARREKWTDKHEVVLMRAMTRTDEKARVRAYGAASCCARIDKPGHAGIGRYAE